MSIIAKESFTFFEEGKCNMYGVYLFNMLFAKFLLTQILGDIDGKVWFAKSGILLLLAKKSLLFKTGAESNCKLRLFVKSTFKNDIRYTIHDSAVGNVAD